MEVDVDGAGPSEELALWLEQVSLQVKRLTGKQVSRELLLEAAAAGIPSVAGDTGGVAEAVIDNQTGFVVQNPSETRLRFRFRSLALSIFRRFIFALCR